MSSNISEVLKASLLAIGGSLLPVSRYEISSRYREPQRHYHTLQHIEECLVWLDQFQALATHLDEVRIALLMHDLIYNPREKNNEKRSADYTQQLMKDSGINVSSCVNVYEHIMATMAHGFVENSDACLVMDIDMLILAAEVPRLKQYENQIRLEYSHVPGFIYKVKRKSVLRGFLRQESIFSVQQIRDVYEEKARENIKHLCLNII